MTLLERVTIVNLFAVKQLQADILMSSLGMTQQQYVAFVRFTYRAEWSPHTDIKARVRSRKGSVKPIVLQVGELLPCDDIFNE